MAIEWLGVSILALSTKQRCGGEGDECAVVADSSRHGHQRQGYARRGYVMMTGEVAAVTAAVEAGADFIRNKGCAVFSLNFRSSEFAQLS
jgi:hypothetical protein